MHLFLFILSLYFFYNLKTTVHINRFFKFFNWFLPIKCNNFKKSPTLYQFNFDTE